MDIVDLTKEIDKLNRETIPLLQGVLNQLVKDLHSLVDRVNNAKVVMTFQIPEKGKGDYHGQETDEA